MSHGTLQADRCLSMAEGGPLPFEGRTFREAILENANRHSEKTAIISDHESISKSFRQLFEESICLAENLIATCGLKHGDHVAIATGNCYNYFVSLLACAIKGLIVWDYDPNLTPSEVLRFVDTVKPSAIFTLGLKSPKLAYFPNMAATISMLHEMSIQIIAVDGEPYNMANSYHFEDLLGPSADGATEGRLTNPSDPLLVWSSSGSTGTPKMIMWSNRNLLALVEEHCTSLGLGEGDKLCIPSSIQHSYGQLLILNSLFSGHQIILTGYRYSAKKTISCLVKYDCNYLAIVPTMLSDILDKMVKDDLELKLTNVIVSCSAFNQSLASRLAAILPDIVCHQIYGSSEMEVTNSVVNIRSGSVGKPMRGVKVKIVDDNGQIVSLGETGQLLVSSCIGMMGYLTPGGAVGNSVLDKDCYYKTGDVFKMDAQGKLYYQYRVKDVINRGGFKVSPKAVEQVFSSIPGVLDCVVLGIPDKRLGEDVVAVVQLDVTAELSEETLLALVSTKLSKFNMPRRVHVSAESLPRLSSLKHDKQLLRALMSNN